MQALPNIGPRAIKPVGRTVDARMYSDACTSGAGMAAVVLSGMKFLVQRPSVHRRDLWPRAVCGGFGKKGIRETAEGGGELRKFWTPTRLKASRDGIG